MTNQHPSTTVLVTGATGYLAGWIIATLLEQGYRVRGTVRDLDRAEPARQTLASHAHDGSALDFVRADLLDDDGWAAAFDGVDAVIHTASPMPFDRESDLIVSATEGTRRVLTAAAHSGVRRVVVTSSGTVAQPGDPGRTATEEIWTAPSGSERHIYPDSKIHAERLAWEVADQFDLQMTAVLPSFMQGPPVGAPERSGTIDVIRRLLNRAMPALPHLGWNVVDVRDVAELHVRALEQPRSIGERYHGAGTFLWYRDVALILREGIPGATRVPTRELPDFVVRMAAKRDRNLAMIVDELGVVRNVDTRKAREQLGWETRDVRTTILDTARAIRAQEQPV